ncbi:MAG: DUF1549 domain-containing protein [Planctomycetia bacterium]|nr:DUF1549 domain-containing protein [Planctomycetia bacterium]
MPVLKHLTKLLPLVVVLAVASLVARAARSPLPPAEKLPEVGIEIDDLKAAVARVNASFTDRWKESGIRPAGPADDLQVLRRLSLALHGTIPSLQEIRQFQGDSRADRLEHWTRRLLADRRFADYFAERLARGMVGKEGGQFIISRRDRFVDWLSEQLQKNTPYDALVRKVISETGLWTGNPATNFVTAAVNEADVDENKLAGKTVRVFLGQRIDCAQCHDHPFDHWKQSEFEGLASFYGQVRTSGLVGIEDLESKDGKPIEYEVEDRKTLKTRVVPVKVPFHSEWLPEQGTRRARLAAWITHPSNRRFERAIANRVWALLFGRAYHEPVDDLADPPESTRDVLDLLGDDFRSHNCDLRRLIQVVAASEPFRLSSEYELPSAADRTPAEQLAAINAAHGAWAVFPLIRLRPEQVIGSLFQSSSIQTIDQNSHLLFRTLRLIQGGQFVNEYGDLGENELLDRGGTIPQRLLMLNGELAAGPTRGNPVNAVSRISAFASTDEKCVETAYLCCLSRFPDAEEQACFVGRLRDTHGGDRRQIVEDLIWALFNSTEYSWNH